MNTLNQTTKLSGSGAPNSVPVRTGMFYFDDLNGAAYLSVNTESTGLSWKKITP